MGFFSSLFKSLNTIPLLDDSELRAVSSFYENGWARRIRNQMITNNESVIANINEHSLIRGLKKRLLSEDEIRDVIVTLEKDMKLHEEDPDEKQIIRKLRACLNGLKQGDKDPEGREVELLPCPICERWAILEKRNGKCLAGCPSCSVSDIVGSRARKASDMHRFAVQEWPNEEIAIKKWNELVNTWLEENGML